MIEALLNVDADNNIIDLMPYLEGQKFGWTVDMTRAILAHSPDECQRLLKHARESLARDLQIKSDIIEKL